MEASPGHIICWRILTEAWLIDARRKNTALESENRNSISYFTNWMYHFYLYFSLSV